MKSFGALFIVIVLSVAVWTFFDQQGMRLTAPETLVVVGGWFGVVALARWALSRGRTKRKSRQERAKGRNVAGGVVLLLALVGARTAATQTNSGTGTAEAVEVACSPDRPVIAQGESVELHAWAKGTAGEPLRYTWTVTAGQIEGQGNKVNWSLKGAASGIYRADLHIVSGSGTGTCSIRVAVSEPDRGAQRRETGRGLLPKGRAEETGYGLYSYLLLGSRPDEGTKLRYSLIINAYLNKIDPIEKYEELVSRNELNITYLPVDTAAGGTVNGVWLLEHYDYARARVLLDHLPGGRRDGIYLVSSLKPLSRDTVPPYLIQDLTNVPTEPSDLLSWWVGEFLSQAAQERFWDTRTTQMFTLKLRTTIAVIATGLPEVQRALTTWIAWLR